MARHGQQLIDHSRVGGRLMSADLAWAWAVPQGTGEEPASGRQVPLLRDQHVDDLSDFSAGVTARGGGRVEPANSAHDHPGR
jgi:hypothetical protein